MNKVIPLIYLSILFCANLAFSLSAHETESVEVPIQRVFIPAHGYDDNDSIEAVIEGELPNFCYSLGRAEVSKPTGEGFISIRQYALKQTGGICADSEQDLPQLKTTVPFTDTVSLGQLKSADYQLRFFPAQQKPAERGFHVAAATAKTVDTLPYASLSQISVPDYFPEGHNVLVEVRGTLNNSCYELADKVEVKRMDDVSVLLTTVEIERAEPCLMVVRPFTVMVNLGELPAGRHLVHARSMHGKALNRVVTVRGRAAR
jgi:hypothetical protein